MPEFLAPVDIGNRAAQHIGADRQIDRTAGFAEVSKLARNVGASYGKLRRAELERNVWTFATRRVALRPIDTNTMLLAPTVWSSTTTYLVGSIVDDGTGTLWQSRIPDNLNFQPTTASGTPSTAWEPYFGPMTALLWGSTTTYNAGEIVYTTAGDGTYRVYLSLISANSDTPATATAWAATTTYRQNQVITYSSTAYASLIDNNLNQTPSASPAAWASGTTYAAGARVCGSDGVIYTSIGNGNIAHNPTTTGGVYWTNTGVLCPWTTTIPAGSGSINWREIGGTDFPMGVGLAELNIVYPLGSGPLSQPATLNVYRLPAGFLRIAPDDPKAGANSYLGSPTSALYNDWLYESDYIVTRQNGTIFLRFVADVQDVAKMKTMFCEGLAARIGMEICQAITNSSAKVAECRLAYKEAMGEARTINAIEAGSEESPMDDYLACRY